MFWESRDKQSDACAFLVSGSDVYSYADVFKIGDDFFRGDGGSVCLIACDRSVQTVAAYLGCLRQSIVPILVDAGLSVDLINDMANQYQADTILHSRRLETNDYRNDGTFGFFNVYRAKNPTDVLMNDQLRLVLPTSGSTGDPKCVRLDSENIDSCTKEIVRYLNLDGNRISISSLPFHYTYGLSVLHCVLETRSKMVLTDLSLIDKEFWALLEQHQVTDFSGVPFMFEVLRRIKLSPTILINLKCVTQAGGRLDIKHTEHFANLFSENDISYFTMYGQTEASPRISYVPPENALAKLGSVGIALDIGRFYTDALDCVSEGELIYEGPNVCMGYAYNREDLSKPDSNKGVLKTGDIATIDNEGFATIVGRKKRFVKVYGSSVNLDDLESKLKGKSFDTAVIGRDEKIIVLTVDDAIAEIKNYLYSFVNFPTRAIKIIKIDEINYSSVGKPDYASMAKEYL
jgi:acyl-CoA synthetase (AMP-forming)/AMP-acid ligase II|tara:strand:- start:14346 stop:15725 length:1380 start_codon:yes stop_codon:yes gene_type:complete